MQLRKRRNYCCSCSWHRRTGRSDGPAAERQTYEILHDELRRPQIGGAACRLHHTQAREICCTLPNKRERSLQQFAYPLNDRSKMRGNQQHDCEKGGARTPPLLIVRYRHHVQSRTNIGRGGLCWLLDWPLALECESSGCHTRLVRHGCEWVTAEA